jgi:undecaprenyl diphosphate synthase
LPHPDYSVSISGRMAATPPTKKKNTHLPDHVAIIMDGNGRWAKQRSLPRFEGHRAGVENMHSAIEHFNQLKVKYLTLFGFSTENWNRPKEEINGLLSLLQETIDEEALKLHRQEVRIRHLGQLDRLPPNLQVAINKIVDLTKNNTGLNFSFAFSYGGRTEIVDAVRRLIAEGIPAEKIDEKLFSRYLYTADLPEVDLVIRTGGELRVSNFLIWQAAYSEYYFTPVLWPDFDKKEIDQALLAYSQRQRRFGGL